MQCAATQNKWAHTYILYPRSLLVNIRVEPLVIAPLVGFGQLEKVPKSTADFML